MRQWQLLLALNPKKQQPLYLQLAEAIADAVHSSRLHPGDPLPGTRSLAQMLGVNRNTVIAGYEELLAEGLVETRIGGGTFVATPSQTRAASPLARQRTPSYTLAAVAANRAAVPATGYPPPGSLALWSVPDLRLLPGQSLARAFRRAIGNRGHTVIQYCSPAGHPRLRTQLAVMLSRTRGLAVGPDDIVITRSIEQAIELVARALVSPGDTVVVEAWGYPPAWNALKLAGARLLPLPVDQAGLDVDALPQVLARQSIRAVFLTPHHQFPTATTLSPERRERLSRLALEHRFAIIEDDYDHEYHYQGRPLLPLAAGPGAANAIYVGSLANLLAPGLGTSFISAPPLMLEAIRHLRVASDSGGDAAVECAIAELFEDGEILRHIRRMRRIYAGRRDALATSLRQRLGSALEFQLPDGGMGLWARVDDGIDVQAWRATAERLGVLFRDGDSYAVQPPIGPACLRLGFTFLDEREMDQAVARMARALADLGRSRSGARSTAITVPRQLSRGAAGHADR